MCLVCIVQTLLVVGEVEVAVEEVEVEMKLVVVLAERLF